MVPRLTSPGPILPRPFYRTQVATDFIRYLPDGWLRWMAIRLAAPRYKRLQPRAFARSGDNVMLIGCCWIETIAQWVESVGPTGHVYVVEADPNTCERLKVEVHKRSIPNVTIYHQAVWREQAELTFLVYSDSRYNFVKGIQADPTDTQPDIGAYTETRVPASSFPEIIDTLAISHIDHLEIAISGAEIELFEGAPSVLQDIQRRGDTIRTYCALRHLESGSTTGDEIAHTLSNLGYRTAIGPRSLKTNSGDVVALRR